MSLFKIISFLTGYVTVLIRGNSPERVINMASSRGIWLWNIRWVNGDKLSACIRLSGVRPLRHIARECGCRYSIEHRRGLPFLIARMRRRKTMAVGAVLFVILLYVMSSFVWFVDVTGNVNIKEGQVREAARQAGLYRGAWKWNLDKSAAEKSLLEQLPNAAWVGIHVDGTRVVVEVVEKKLPPQNIDNRPAHIVAKKEGLLKEILVLQGQPKVEEGQTIKKGDILISGEIIPPVKDEPGGETVDEEQEKPRYVHARGIVRARVWYEGYGECQLVQEGTRRTGNEISRVCAQMGDKQIILFGPRSIAYEQYEEDVTVKKLPRWRNIGIPVEINVERYYELEKYRQKRTLHEAREKALEKAIAGARKKIPSGAKVLDQKIHEVSTGQEDNVVRVKVLIETLEDIGREKLFSPQGGNNRID